MMPKTANSMTFTCANCGLERSYPSRQPGSFTLQYCWEGQCAPQRILDVLGPLPVQPSIQRKPPIIQDRTRCASNRS
jgi:hypothetical protein